MQIIITQSQILEVLCVGAKQKQISILSTPAKQLALPSNPANAFSSMYAMLLPSNSSEFNCVRWLNTFAGTFVNLLCAKINESKFRSPGRRIRERQGKLTTIKVPANYYELTMTHPQSLLPLCLGSYSPEFPACASSPAATKPSEAPRLIRYLPSSGVSISCPSKQATRRRRKPIKLQFRRNFLRLPILVLF